MSEIFVVSLSVRGLPNFCTSTEAARATTQNDTTARAVRTRDIAGDLLSVAKGGHEMTIPHFCNNIDEPMSDRPSSSDGLPHVSGLKATGIFLLLTVVFTW